MFPHRVPRHVGFGVHIHQLVSQDIQIVLLPQLVQTPNVGEKGGQVVRVHFKRVEAGIIGGGEAAAVVESLST